ncbi:MAG: dTDP-4-dehydrorhamnose reductase [Alistipes sp.]|nr:dTDP-4-dehydrorhamnose reductase [Alistipes sp.]
MEKSSTKGRVLVTGAGGQLGRSLQKIAGRFQGMELYCPDERDADITDRGRIESILRAHNIKAVINCAAYTAVDMAEEEEEKAYEVNAFGPGLLAALSAKYRIPLIHISTDYVFDGKSGEPYTEQAAANPLGAYGRSKLAGEKAVKDSGCDAVVIRTSWLYSEFGNNFVDTMLKLGSQGRALRVVFDQKGTPTYATDLANAAMMLLEEGFTGFDILHYSALGDTTWYGFAREIFLRAGIAADVTPVTTREYPVKAPRPKNSVMCMDKARKLGLPLRPWQEALAECIGEING